MFTHFQLYKLEMCKSHMLRLFGDQLGQKQNLLVDFDICLTLTALPDMSGCSLCIA